MGPPDHGEAGAGSDLLLLMPCVLLPNDVPQYTRGHRDRCCRKFNSKPPIFRFLKKGGRNRRLS